MQGSLRFLLKDEQQLVDRILTLIQILRFFSFPNDIPMNLICPHCSQALEDEGVPPGTQVNCVFCRNDFLTPDLKTPLLTGYRINTSLGDHNEIPEGLFKKLTTFRGRIGRLQYFYGLLLKLMLMFFCGFFLLIFYSLRLPEVIVLAFALPAFLLVVWINLSLQARRLHDMGQSGLWLLLYLIPFVNYIFGVIIYLLCLVSEGSKKKNKYGERPYEIFQI